MKKSGKKVIKHHLYNEFPYDNSDKEPLGLTFNGNTKDYIEAHQQIKEFVMKKKSFKIDKKEIKINDTSNHKVMLNIIIELNDEVSGEEGNVELKLYEPSNIKKKGATIELRKMSGFDYSYVDSFRKVILKMLDNTISGENLLSNKKSIQKKLLYSCDKCEWKTKFENALQIHISKMHRQDDKINCKTCSFVAETDAQLKVHISSHGQGSKRGKESVSPTSSPPSKRILVKENADIKDDKIDLEVEYESENIIKKYA